MMIADIEQIQMRYKYYNIQSELNIIMIRKYLINVARTNLLKQRNKFSQNIKNSKEDSLGPKEKEESDQLHEQQKELKYENQNRNTIGWMIWRVIFWGSFAAFSYNCYLVAYPSSLPVEKQTGAIPGFIDAAKITYRSYNDARSFFSQPPVKKLLTDPIHPLMQPKTLVLNVTGTILHSHFVFGKGMELNRRPHLNQFLNKLCQMYEIIIFSDDDFMFLGTVLPKIDPKMQILSGYFGRECMVWSEGSYIKDLKYLNRDLKNIIVIDKSLQNIKKHTKNGIILKQYKGQENDTQLLKLLPLLESLAGPEVKDVRKVLQTLGQNPQDKYQEVIKAKQENIKSKQSSKFFSIFSSKK